MEISLGSLRYFIWPLPSSTFLVSDAVRVSSRGRRSSRGREKRVAGIYPQTVTSLITPI